MKCPECGEVYAQHAHGWYILHKAECPQVVTDTEVFGMGAEYVPGAEE